MATTPDPLASGTLQMQHFLKTTFLILANKRTVSTALMDLYLNSRGIMHSLPALPKSPLANFFPKYYVSSGENTHTFTTDCIYLLLSVTDPCFLKEACLLQ